MIYRFGPFELDTAKVELRSAGEVCSVELQVFALLALLVDNRERLVSKDEIIEKVWDGRVVSEAAVASRIKSARKVLGDDGKTQHFIRTIHGQGFRFVAEAKVARAAAGRSVDQISQPSIAILPFRSIGAVGSFAAIADALPHELITELSRLRWLFVTARESSFRLRGSEADIGEIGHLLDVRYCLSGTVEIAGASLSVTVDLVDTRDGGVVWADHFAGLIDDVHQIRVDIRSRILAALEIQIPLREAALARLTVTENLDAWSAYHLGLQHMYRFNRKDNVAATALFQRAVTRDPSFARAHAGLSFVHFQTAFMHYSDDIAGEIALARRFALRGIEARAWTESLAGRGLDGRRHVDLAMRLSPLDPLYYAMLATRAFTHMVMGEDAEAADWAERAARSPGAHVLIALIAVAAHALGGDEIRAASWAANVRLRSPALTRSDFFRAFPMKSAAIKARVSNSLARFGF
ncbi:MAG: transcriptional regulator [Gammaproteobacteria bacterium]|nr:transcriptional regulator [Gammaproteobacteria bacterium]